MDRRPPVILAPLLALALGTALFGAPGCVRTGGVTSVERAETPAGENAAGSGAGSPAVDVADKPAEVNGLRNIYAGTAHTPVHAGDLTVTLAEIGPGPTDDVEGGQVEHIKPWTERLTAVINVRNDGDDVEELWIEQNSPVITDHKGHMRPALDGSGSIDARGLAQDDSGLKRHDGLAPGGTVRVTQSFEIRTDDHERPLTLSYRLTPDTLVRWRLW